MEQEMYHVLIAWSDHMKDSLPGQKVPSQINTE